MGSSSQTDKKMKLCPSELVDRKLLAPLESTG
jgi:hypothetical protein